LEGVDAVLVLPSPNCHADDVQLEDELALKFTHNGPQPEVTSEVSVTAGNGFTVTVTVCVSGGVVQPSDSITVYVVVEAGETVCDAPVRLPGSHVYTRLLSPPEPEAVSVVLLPAHTAAADSALSVSGGFTVTVIVCTEELHPIASVTYTL